MARLLIAEDDPVIAAAMATHLRHAGFDVEVADRGDRAMRKLRFERPDAAIIDLMLPGMDGWQITKDARAEGMQIPVLIVSARASEPDKVHALASFLREKGAESVTVADIDYVFSRENPLYAKLEAGLV